MHQNVARLDITMLQVDAMKVRDGSQYWFSKKSDFWIDQRIEQTLNAAKVAILHQEEDMCRRREVSVESDDVIMTQQVQWRQFLRHTPRVMRAGGGHCLHFQGLQPSPSLFVLDHEYFPKCSVSDACEYAIRVTRGRIDDFFG